MWKEDEHPRNENGEFVEKVKSYSKMSTKDLKEEAIKDTKKMTPAEKIASVHIDFDKDNILPELDDIVLNEMGVIKNRKVLLKKRTIARNEEKHPDVKREDYRLMLSSALYGTQEVRKGKNENGTYYSLLSFVKYSNKHHNPLFSAVVLDVVPNGEYFEIVHWHWVKQKNLHSI